MNRIRKDKKKNDRIGQYFNQYTTEQRLKIIADLIINRLIEQENRGYGQLNQK